MERAAGGLKKIVLDAIRQAPPHEAALLAWPVIVGRAIAAQTKALEFTNGVLRVEVPDRNWRAELSAFAGQYIAAYRPVAKIESIDFVIAGERPRREKSPATSD
jgi:hypothetical protein